MSDIGCDGFGAGRNVAALLKLHRIKREGAQ